MSKKTKADEEKEKTIAEYEKQKEIDATYKEKYNAIAKNEVFFKNKSVVCYWKAPHRMALGAALAILERDTLAGCEIIFDSAIIPDISVGWEEVRSDNGAMIGLVPYLQSLCVVKKNIFTPL
jgi:hypothetical protein